MHRTSAVDARDDIADRQPGERAVVQEGEGRVVHGHLQGRREGRPHADDPMGSGRRARQSVQNTHRLASLRVCPCLSLSPIEHH